MTIRISATFDPEQPSGTEPWDLPLLLAASGRSVTDSRGMLAVVGKLRLHGVRALNQPQRAFWLSYQNSAQSPLPSVEPTDLPDTSLEAAIAAFQSAADDVADYVATADKVESSLLSSNAEVGIFAKRGPIRSVALPDWCKAAIVVNTKARYWEVLANGHHAGIALPAVMSAVLPSGATVSGHRYRVRVDGLPSVSTLHTVFNTLTVNLAALRRAA